MNAIFPDLDLEVSWHYDGKYRPATYNDPAEYPDLVIDSCLDEDGNEVYDTLSAHDQKVVDQFCRRYHEEC